MAKQFVLCLGLIEDEENIALVLNRWGIGDVWGLPGGELETGEALTDCVVREVQEETGLLVAPVELSYVVDAHNLVYDYHFLVHVFSCRVVNGILRAPDNPADDVVDAQWVRRDEVARYVTWPTYRDPLLAYLAGHDRKYWLDRDAYRPEDGKGPRPTDQGA
jgi:8-oxo-dGTP diphosphatase